MSCQAQTRSMGYGEPQADSLVKSEMEAKISQEIRSRYPNQSLVGYQELQRSQSLLIVDVRDLEEVAVSMIPGAISGREFESQIHQYSGYELIFYCTIGWRSGDWANKYQALGWVTHNYIGGVLDWSHQGMSFVNQEGMVTDTVHVYSPSWNYLAAKYYAVDKPIK